MIDLYDCPFCGGAGLLEEENGWCWYVTCMDCGCCAYSCPARKQLNFEIKQAKTLVMEDDKKKKAKAEAEAAKAAAKEAEAAAKAAAEAEAKQAQAEVKEAAKTEEGGNK